MDTVEDGRAWRVRFAGEDGASLALDLEASGAVAELDEKAKVAKLGGHGGLRPARARARHDDARRARRTRSTAVASAGARGARPTGTSIDARAHRSALVRRRSRGVTLTAIRPAKRLTTTSPRRSPRRGWRPRATTATAARSPRRRRRAPVDHLRRRGPPAHAPASSCGSTEDGWPAPRGRRGRLRDVARPRPAAARLRVLPLAHGRPRGRRALRHPAQGLDGRCGIDRRARWRGGAGRRAVAKLMLVASASPPRGAPAPRDGLGRLHDGNTHQPSLRPGRSPGGRRGPC